MTHHNSAIDAKTEFDILPLLKSAQLLRDEFFLITFFCVALWAGYEYAFNKTGVPTLATLPRMRRKMITRLKQDAVSHAGQLYTIIDLGSGNGQLSRAIARAIPTAQVIGIEISYLPWLRATLTQKLFGPANLTYQRRDFWNYDCSKINAVVLYLVGKKMARIGAKLHRELKPGALIISNRYALRDGWQPQETITFRTFFKNTLYIYRQP